MLLVTRVGVLCLLAAVACSSAPEVVVPFRGDYRPRSIAVLPIQAEGLPAKLCQELDARAHSALQRRGYEVVPAAVTRRFLVSIGAPSPRVLDATALQRMRDEYHVDAVMLRKGRALEQYRDPLEGFAVQWSLVDTMTGRTIWVQEQGGGSRRNQQLTLRTDSPYADDPLLSDEPMVQRSTDSWVRELPPPSVGAMADTVQLALAARLPFYEEPR